jgi:hypothetical protein
VTLQPLTDHYSRQRRCPIVRLIWVGSVFGESVDAGCDARPLTDDEAETRDSLTDSRLIPICNIDGVKQLRPKRCNAKLPSLRN